MSNRCQNGDHEENLSVVPRTLVSMTMTAPDDSPQTAVFDDPVTYLAELGITAQLVSETTLPAAA